MPAVLDPAPADGRTLTLSRLLAAPRRAVWRAWTEPDLVRRWFAPAPWTVAEARFDLRPGGSSLVVMRSPEGVEHPSRGVFLDVVENERLVFTDAFVEAWTPSGHAFMTASVTLSDAGDATRYDVGVGHWTAEDRARHEDMGFTEGWSLCAAQLEEVARTLR